jgi:hypothetical protein
MLKHKEGQFLKINQIQIQIKVIDQLQTIIKKTQIGNLIPINFL